TARAYKKAVAEANAKALLEGSDNTETNEGLKAKVKKKRSLVGEHYYEEFSTEF
ncbi:6869_t:CDS:1, partial [Funneliformis mosseae]